MSSLGLASLGLASQEVNLASKKCPFFLSLIVGQEHTMSVPDVTYTYPSPQNLDGLQSSSKSYNQITMEK